MLERYYKQKSTFLNRNMEVKVYGESGKPVIVFPADNEGHADYEKHGMVEVCRPFIEAGKICLVTIDSVDKQAWLDVSTPIPDKAILQRNYEQYVSLELASFIRGIFPAYDTFKATGCGMGAYQAMNMFLKFPHLFDTVIALSGRYNLDFCNFSQIGSEVVAHSPLCYLPRMTSDWYMDLYGRSKIIICSGQGNCEEHSLKDTFALDQLLNEFNIPHWTDIWGEDVSHDWSWWQKQLHYFLSCILDAKCDVQVM